MVRTSRGYAWWTGGVAAALALLAMPAIAGAQTAPEAVYYKFNEGTGTTTTNHASPGMGTATPQFVNANNVPVTPNWTTASALGSHAITGNGNTFLPTGFDPRTLNSGNWTIEFWIRTGTLVQRQAILGDGGKFGIYILPTTGNCLIYDNTTGATAWSGGNVHTGNWHHVAFVFNSANNMITSFVDGQVSMANQPFNFNITTTQVSLMRGGYVLNLGGALQPIANFSQSIDEFRIWTRSRTAGEMLFFHDREAPFPMGLHMAHMPAPGSQLPVPPGTQNVMVGHVMCVAVGAQSISGWTVDQIGTASDGDVSITLWRDMNLNHQLEPGTDQPLGSAPTVNGQASITGTPLVTLSSGQFAVFFMTATVASGAAGGGTFQAELSTGASVQTNNGNGHVHGGTFPMQWPSHTIFGPATIPYFTDWEALPYNHQFVTGAGSYPVASAAGQFVGVSSYAGSANARIQIGNPSNQQPYSGNRMVGIDFPAGDAIGALDLHFDLSGYNLATDPIQLMFQWNNTGMEPNIEDNVFVSVNGGLSWITSLYRFPFPAGSGWNQVTVDVSAALLAAGANPTNLSDVVIRFQARDNAPFNTDGLLIDDILLAVPSVVAQARRLTNTAVMPGAEDVVVGAFDLTALFTAQEVAAVQVTRDGSLSLAERGPMRLYLDNGDGQFGPGDTLLGTYDAPGEMATFAGSPLVNLPANGTARIFVVTDLAESAAPGEAFSVTLNDANSVVASSGVATVGAFPARSAHFRVFRRVNALPWNEHFHLVPPANLIPTTHNTGGFPRATAAGASISFGSTPPHLARLHNAIPGPLAGMTPRRGANFAGIDFPDGTAVGAMDFYFDLSAYDATMHKLMLEFSWAEVGGTTNFEDGVFLSLDGGQTWRACLVRFNPAGTPNRQWQYEKVDLSAALVAAGGNYSDNVVIRFQGAGSNPFSASLPAAGFVFDEIRLSFPGRMELKREGNLPLPHDSTDHLGTIAGPGTTSVQYAMRNVGNAPLEVFGLALENMSGVPGTDAIELSDTNGFTLLPGEIRLVTLTAELSGPASIAFDLAIETNDPLLAGGRHVVNVSAIAGNVGPSVVPAPGSAGITGSQGAGYVVGARIAQPLEGVSLSVDDPNGGQVQILSITGSGPGLSAPGTVGMSDGPIELSWSGTPREGGKFLYRIRATDGSLTTTTTLTVIVAHPIEDVRNGGGCGTMASPGAVPSGLVLVLLALAGLGWRRRQ